MHYVTGHEVAEQMTREVCNVALSPTIAWNKANGEGKGSFYWFKSDDLVATKVVDQFDCPPENLLELIRTSKKMGYGSLDINVLEEYDSCNQILVLKSILPLMKRLAYTCIYRCTYNDYPANTHYMVFQTIDHEKVVEDPTWAWWNYAPSGYVITPLPDDPNRCQMIFVTQITDMGIDTPDDFVRLFCETGGLTARAFEELRDIAREYKTVQMPARDIWKENIRDMRRALYSGFFDLNAENNWNLTNIRGLELFTRQNKGGEYCAALRSSFFSPDPCDKVAIRLYQAIRHANEWNAMTFKSTILEEIGESASVVLNEMGSYATGAMSDSLALVTCSFNRDGICDLAFKSIEHEKFPPVAGRPRNFFPLCGFIISPNPHGSTIQYLLQPPPSMSDEGLKVSLGRLISYIHSLRSYITRQPTNAKVNEPPASEEYSQVFGEFAKMVLSTPPPDPDQPSPPAYNPPSPPPRKRKYSSSTLVTVDELVRKITPGESPARPFLFLVPNVQGGQRRRFVRRRWETLLSNSVFDLLPEELFESIVSYLDISSMLKMSLVCARFKDLMSNKRLWKGQFRSRFGKPTGQIAKRYCGDEDPNYFFTDSFSLWKELYLEKHCIEAAWEPRKRPVHRFRVDHAHSRAVRSIVHLPLCHRLVTGSLDKLVRVWDATAGGCLATLPGESGVVALVSTQERDHIKAGYKSGSVRIIDAGKGETLHEIKFGAAMRGCTFLPGRVATWDEDIELWEEETQQQLYTLNEHTRHITECVFSPKASLLYSSSRDRIVKMWDLRTATKTGEIAGHTRGVNGLVLVGENLCVTVSSDSSMRVWDKRNVEKPLLVRTEHTGKIRCIRYSDIGQRICTGGADGVHTWRSDDFSHIRYDHVDQSIVSLALDEESVAYGSTRGVLQYYDFVPHN